MKAEKHFIFTDATAKPFNFCQGNYLFSKSVRDYAGNPSVVKITSIKTWKREHNPEFEVNFKHGLYGYGTIYPHRLHDWATSYREYKVARYTMTWRRNKLGNVKLTK